MKYAQSAANHAKSVVDLIKNKLAEDTEKRTAGKVDEIGLAYAFQRQTILTNAVSKVEVISKITGSDVRPGVATSGGDDEVMEVVEAGNGVAEMIKSIRNEVEAKNGESSSGEEDESSSEEEVAVVKSVKGEDKRKVAEVNLDDSEEEETVTLGGGI